MKKHFFKLASKVLVALVLLSTNSIIWAQSYVFIYKNGNTYNFLRRDGNNVNNTTTFNAGSCVWTRDGNKLYNGTGTNKLERNDPGFRLGNGTNWTFDNDGRVHDGNIYIRYNSGWTSNNNPSMTAEYTVCFAYENHASAIPLKTSWKSNLVTNLTPSKTSMI